MRRSRKIHQRKSYMQALVSSFAWSLIATK
jgi:hypothetical protein